MVEKKIAALGVHVARGVTTHGFALNVSTDLNDFNMIVPCGIADRGVTSLESEAQTPPGMEQVIHSVSRHFGRVFGRQMLWLQTLDDLLATLAAKLHPNSKSLGEPGLPEAPVLTTVAVPGERGIALK